MSMITVSVSVEEKGRKPHSILVQVETPNWDIDEESESLSNWAAHDIGSALAKKSGESLEYPSWILIRATGDWSRGSGTWVNVHMEESTLTWYEVPA